MKHLPLPLFQLGFCCLLVPYFGMITAQGENPSKQDSIISKKTISAAKFIESKLSDLESEDFSNSPAGRNSVYGGFPVSPKASHLECLRADFRAAFADIQLAREHKGAKIDPQNLIDLLVSTRSNNYFGTNGHINEQAFTKKTKLIDQLVADPELRFADRLFLILKSENDTYDTTLRKWLDRAQVYVGNGYLKSETSMPLSHQARLTREMVLFSTVIKSKHVNDASSESPRVFVDLQNFITNTFNLSVRKYCKDRFVKDGALRDRGLPVLLASQKSVPGLSLETVGITRQKEVEKMALAHARGLSSLVEVIDAEMADTHEARKSIGQIIDYRIQPFYIGSMEVREKGTLPCAPNAELETILYYADFFGKNGHHNEDVYKKRVEKLEQIFLRPSSLETRDFLFALKSPQAWLDYFHETIIESKNKDAAPSVLESIRNGQISSLNLKNLFLARCMLSHLAYDANPDLTKGREAFNEILKREAPNLAVNHFKKMPDRWNRVDLAFAEITKMVPEFDLAGLSIPTYSEYLDQRKDYNWAIASIPRDFVSLSHPDSTNMLDNEVGLFESDYIYRTGKFNKRLSPVFIETLNNKLDIILSYRNSQFSPPDMRRRPGFEVNGSPIGELKVKNRIHPEIAESNPQLHDLLEGPDGGFGGLGKLFHPDPKGYESGESALDAIASSDELKLGETLFRLALDAGVTDPTEADKAAAAKKWLSYFKKTQSVARFHSTPDELRNAIRGAFVCRLVLQTDDFIEAVENSPTAAVGSPEDVSSLLESTLSNQVKIVNSILSAVDPSSALNKDIDYIKSRWYDMKAWHTESMKWLETVVADPALMSEVSRIRSLSREKNRSYDQIAPAISKVEQTLSAVEPRLIAERNSNRHEDLFKPLDFANLVMGQLVTLQNGQKRTSKVQYGDDGDFVSNRNDAKLDGLSRNITERLFEDIRSAVSEAGFEELSKVTSLTQFPTVTRAYYENTDFSKNYEDSAVHDLLLHQLKGAVAKAKGRIEAERITDLKNLEDLSLRASRADRIFFAGDPDRYSLLIDPSFLLHEWNNRHKIETMAEFRTVETRAQAQTQIFRYRKAREKLEAEQKLLDRKQKELEGRLAKARKWAAENDFEFNPDAVIDEMLAMEDRIESLEGQISTHQKIEEKYRQHHFHLAQQLNTLKLEGVKFDRARQREYLLAQADLSKPIELDPSDEFGSSTPTTPKPAPKPKPTYTPPKKTYSKPTTTKKYVSRSSSSSNRSSSSSRYSRPSSSSSSSSRGGFLQRIFRRR